MTGDFRPKPGAKPVQVAPTVWLELPSVGTCYDTPREGWTTLLDLDYDGRRVIPTSVTVTSDGAAVTGKELRDVPVGSLMDSQLNLVGHLSILEGWEMTPSEARAAEIRAEGPTDQNLRYLAEVYLMWRAIGTRPSEMTQFVFGLTRPTAARWFRKARERGLIDGDD